MKAVIMAGGKGTRLQDIAKDIPKPMVNFSGKPILEYQILNLKKYGITDIVIITGYLGYVIEEYFGNGCNFGVNISYVREESPLGTCGALYYLKETLTEDFILLFGDIFIDINFDLMINFHKKNQSMATLLVHPNSHPYDSDLIVMDKNNRLEGWIRKNTPRNTDCANIVNAGIYIFSVKILESISKPEKMDLEKDLIIPLISQNKPIYGYRTTEYVKDMGTPNRYLSVKTDFENGICSARNLSNKQKCIFLDRDGTINVHKGFLNKPEMVELYPEVTEAIKKINSSGYLCIVITNQPVIARGECSTETLRLINNRIDTLLGEEGAYVDDLFYCPHHPDKGYEGEVPELKIVCKCRKPQIGLILEAAEKYNIDLSKSWIIGDTTLDIMTGINAEVKTCLVMTGEAGKDTKYDAKPDVIGENLLDCVNMIMKEGVKFDRL